MNPAKLKSYVDQQSSAPDLSALVGVPTDAGHPDDAIDDEDDGVDEAEPADPLARGNELIASWGEQGEALKEAAGELVDGAHEIGGNLLLATVPEEADEEVEKQYERMPEEIQVTLAQHVADLPADDVAAVVTALISGHDGDTETPDQKLVTTYVTKLAAIAKTEVDPDDFVQAEDEDEDEESEEKSEEASVEAAPVAAPAGQGASPMEAPSKPLA